MQNDRLTSSHTFSFSLCQPPLHTHTVLHLPLSCQVISAHLAGIRLQDSFCVTEYLLVILCKCDFSCLEGFCFFKQQCKYKKKFYNQYLSLQSVFKYTSYIFCQNSPLYIILKEIIFTFTINIQQLTLSAKQLSFFLMDAQEGRIHLKP